MAALVDVTVCVNACGHVEHESQVVAMQFLSRKVWGSMIRRVPFSPQHSVEPWSAGVGEWSTVGTANS